MSDQYLGEIRLFAGSYAPQDWNLCDGTLLPISGNEALYSLLGTAYGGNGTTTFAVPDFPRPGADFDRHRPRPDAARTGGVGGGSETVVLDARRICRRTRTTLSRPRRTGRCFDADADGHDRFSAAPHNTAGNTDLRYIASGTAIANTFSLAPTAVGNAGQNTAHANIMQSVPLTFIIALAGVFPSPS